MSEIPKAVPTVESILPQVPRQRYHRLKCGVPIPEPDKQRWRGWNRRSRDKCLIAIDDIGHYASVTTTFTGVDLNTEEGAPLLYITVVHGSRFAESRYYRTVEEAVKGHEQIVRRIFDEYDDDPGVRFEPLTGRPAQPYTFWQRCGQVLDRVLERIRRLRSSQD